MLSISLSAVFDGSEEIHVIATMWGPRHGHSRTRLSENYRNTSGNRMAMIVGQWGTSEGPSEYNFKMLSMISFGTYVYIYGRVVL